MRRKLTDEERYKKILRGSNLFWSHVDKTKLDGCWPWLLSVNVDGYGMLSYTRAHRAAWMLTNGMITSAEHVLHRCDNPPCCNPSHLFLGDQLINNADRDAKGRQCKGEERSLRFKAALRALKEKDPERYRQNYGERQKGTKNPQAKLSDEDVREIRRSSETQDALSSRFGIAQSTVSKIRLRYRWKHVTDDAPR